MTDIEGRNTGLDVQNRCAIERVVAAEMELASFTPKQLHANLSGRAGARVAKTP
ncbi:hypothetical protein [Verminephrobacter eiseniae]|uniref:hypothetical protein n=1 Tax=Verminephrobacter eiseniae TaxID=364317 RepID=UPI0038B32290